MTLGALSQFPTPLRRCSHFRRKEPRVVSLIQDFAELEARENAEDLAAAREGLVDGEVPVPWEEAKGRLDALHGIR